MKFFLPSFKYKKIIDISGDIFLGSELLIFDLDNTLVYPETIKTKKEIIDWFFKINAKYNCVIISNSGSFPKRAKKVSEIFNCSVFVSRHKKPFPALFYELEKKYKFKKDKVFVIGDRVLTDVLFGNINGTASVLTSPLTLGGITIFCCWALEKFLLYITNLFIIKKNYV